MTGELPKSQAVRWAEVGKIFERLKTVESNQFHSPPPPASPAAKEAPSPQDANIVEFTNVPVMPPESEAQSEKPAFPAPAPTAKPAVRATVSKVAGISRELFTSLPESDLSQEKTGLYFRRMPWKQVHLAGNRP